MGVKTLDHHKEFKPVRKWWTKVRMASSNCNLHKAKAASKAWQMIIKAEHDPAP